MDRPATLNEVKRDFADGFAGLNLNDMVFEPAIVITPISVARMIIPTEGIAARLIKDTGMYVRESWFVEERLAIGPRPDRSLFIDGPTRSELHTSVL